VAFLDPCHGQVPYSHGHNPASRVHVSGLLVARCFGDQDAASAPRLVVQMLRETGAPAPVAVFGVGIPVWKTVALLGIRGEGDQSGGRYGIQARAIRGANDHFGDSVDFSSIAGCCI
jgi:hypothetical protein